MSTSFALNRFLEAQENVYKQVTAELQNGKKTTHWMWFIFPQVDGLGFSSTAKFYAIKSVAEAKEYLSHLVLGKRLMQCAEILLSIEGKSAENIFGYPDYLKLHSSMTLFDLVSDGPSVFEEVLKKYFDGKKDEKTVAICEGMN